MKTRPSTCKTAIMDPLGCINDVLQGRGTSLAQNPIKGAKRKNRPRDTNSIRKVLTWHRIIIESHSRRLTIVIVTYTHITVTS